MRTRHLDPTVVQSVATSPAGGSSHDLTVSLSTSKGPGVGKPGSRLCPCLRIAWYSKITLHSGHGDWQTDREYSELQKIADEYNKIYPDLIHFVEWGITS